MVAKITLEKDIFRFFWFAEVRVLHGMVAIGVSYGR